MHDCKLGDTSFANRDRFSLKQCPMSDLEIKEMQKISYVSAVESFMYAQVCTRPDIAFPMRMLGQYQSNSNFDH